MHNAKRPREYRVGQIDRELQTGTYPKIDRLVELTEANERTVRRDLEYMRLDRGAPLEYCPKHRGWHYTEPTYKLPQIEMAHGEVVALYFAQELLRQHQGMPYEAELARAIQKLTEHLPKEISIHNRPIFDQVHSFRSSVVNLHDVQLFRTLADAVLKRKQIRITYFTASRDEESTRVVDPIHLTLIDGEWYLIGYCHTRKERRMFAPVRINNLEMTGKTFPTPHDFCISDYLKDAFTVVREDGQPIHQIRIRFAPSAAKYIKEKVWHSSQVPTRHPDGSIELTMELASLIEVRRWILSWGSECEVLEPAELRADIFQEASAIASRSQLSNSQMTDPDPTTKPRRRNPT